MTDDAKHEMLAVLADYDLASNFAHQLCLTPSEYPGRKGIEYMAEQITRHRHRHGQPQTDAIKLAIDESRKHGYDHGYYDGSTAALEQSK